MTHITSIVFEHIKCAQGLWNCWSIVNIGVTQDRQQIVFSARSYEESLDQARRTRENWNHLDEFKGVQTHHITR